MYNLNLLLAAFIIPLKSERKECIVFNNGMKKNYLIPLLLILILSSCNKLPKTSSISSTASIISSQENSEDINGSSSNKSSSSNIKTSSSSEVDSSSSSSSSSEEKEQVILPIGNKKLDGPVNNPIDITEWVSYEVDNAMPEGFRHIYGNNWSSASFYRENGNNFAIKFDQLYKGIQSPKLTPFKKIEVRLYINPVNNNSQKAASQKDEVFHIYGYDDEENLITTDYIEQGAITKQKEKTELKFYLRNINLTYFEIRMSAFPYKGSKCYNFGISKISIKGWNYD